MRHAMMTLVSTAALLAGFNGLSMAQEAPDLPITPKISYLCERNVEIQVSYINGLKNEDALAVVYAEGKLIPMRRAISGSGARYIALDEQDSYRWHTKGSEGVLSFMAADHTAEEEVVLRNCVSKDKMFETPQP